MSDHADNVRRLLWLGVVPACSVAAAQTTLHVLNASSSITGLTVGGFTRTRPAS